MLRRRSRRHYTKHKEAARALVAARLSYFNAYYKAGVGKVFIKNTKSRWGSCSERGNLNFNYKIVFLPDELQDYLIVHELCHLRHFNHSREFWQLVGESLPNYREHRRRLREFEKAKSK